MSYLYSSCGEPRWLNSGYLWRDVSWFNPSQQLSTMQPFSPSGKEKRTRRVKATKLVCWDKDCLGKANAMHPSKVKQEINSAFPLDRHMFSLHHESRAPSHVLMTREINSIPLNVPSSFFFPQLYLLSMISYGMGYPCDQPSLLCPIPASPVPPGKDGGRCF